MGLFNFLKSNQNKYDQKELAFLEEVRIATIRYFGSANATLSLKSKTGEPMDFIQAFPNIYSKCDQIKSPWDRRSLMYTKFDELFSNSIAQYVYAERLIDDRQTQKALEILNKIKVPSINSHIYYAVFAKAFVVLGNYELAIEKAKKALEEKSNYIKAKIILADAYYLSGQTDEARNIYDLHMNKYFEESVNQANGKVNIVKLFGVEEEKVNSPIAAVEFLKYNNLPEEAWIFMEDEFYYSPYFRCQYAYWILESKKEIQPAFEKLLTLFKEMPWVKEAAINALVLFEKLDTDNENAISKQDIEEINTAISNNGWTSEGVYRLTFSIE